MRKSGCPAGSQARTAPAQEVLEANHPVAAAPGPSRAASLLGRHPTQRQGHHGNTGRFLRTQGLTSRPRNPSFPDHLATHRGSGATQEYPRGPSGPALVSPYAKPPRAPSKAWPFHPHDQRGEPPVTPEEWHEGAQQTSASSDRNPQPPGRELWPPWSLPAQPRGLRPV